MRSITRVSFFFALASLAFAAATAAAAEDARRIDELMHKSGIWEQVASVRDQVKSGVREAWTDQKNSGRPGTSALDLMRLEAAVDKAFAADTMRRAVAAELGSELAPKDVDEVLVWLDTDLGRKLTRLEEEASRAEETVKTEKDARELVAKVPPARLAQYERLVTALRLDQANVETTLNMMAAIIYAVAAASPQADPDEAVRQLRKSYEPQRKQMEAHFHQLALASMSRSYRGVSDADLQRYAVFNETPAGRRYNDAATKAFERALVQGCLELGRQLGRDAQTPSRTL
jgi:hypothetical protein